MKPLHTSKSFRQAIEINKLAKRIETLEEENAKLKKLVARNAVNVLENCK